MTYCLASDGLNVGDFIMNGENSILKSGNSTILDSIPIGIKISCLEIYPNSGAQFIRAAGTYATIISKSDKICVLKLKSGEIRKANSFCMATVGIVSNFKYMYRNFKKAGYFRLKG
jgi:large subunit ribosomal protein L2